MNSFVFSVIIFGSTVFSQSQTDPDRGITTVNSLEGMISTTTQSYLIGGIWSSTGVNTVELPKCCPYGFAVSSRNCSETSVKFQPKFDVHDHNDTAFDDVPIRPELITFNTYIHNPCEGKKFPLSPEEKPKILLNGTLLLGGLNEYDGLLGHDRFCIDNLEDVTDPSDDTVYAFVCIIKHREGYPQWVFSTYMTLITISALLFTSSAMFFYRQYVQGVHKKSFMAYALSMSATYLVIVITQFISGGCNGYGLLLQFLITMSFAWLAILCFDLAWMIQIFWKPYELAKDLSFEFIDNIAVSVIYCTIFLIISLTNNFTPDIPGSFFKPQFRRSKCSNLDINQRRGFFYTALILSVLISVLSLGYSLIKMNHNRYKNNNDGVQRWKKVSAKYRNMYGRLVIIFVTMIVWFLDSFSDRFADNSGITNIILLVQAVQGFIVVPLFTMKSIRHAIDISKKPRIENLEELIAAKNTDSHFDRA